MEGTPAPRTIGLNDLQGLLGEQAVQTVEVLPAKEYRWAHLPGALHIPLEDLDAASVGKLDASLLVVVYCHDFL